MREEYYAEIRESSVELSRKESIAFKDLSDAYGLDSIITDSDEKVISPIGYVIIDVHNEKSDNKDYTKYVIVDENGNKYVTGSESFFNSFADIWESMTEDGKPVEPFEIKIYKKPSKNFSGKSFLTCSIVA